MAEDDYDLGHEQYIEKWQQKLAIDQNALDREVEMQPYLFFQVADECAQALSRRDSAYDELKRTDADLNFSVRESLAESGQRRVFVSLAEKYPPQMVYDLIREMERDNTEFEEEHADRILENAEGQTHMQKMVQEFAEKGEIETDNEDFELEDVVDEVIASNQDAVEDYKDGRESALNYLLGQVMQETSGRADGGEARQKLVEKLE